MSHEATRTGAPIALLHFLRWFKKNTDRPFSILLSTGGELIGEFQELAATWPVDHSRWCPGGARRGILGGLGLGEWGRRAEIADVQRFVGRCKPALFYANSIASGQVVDMLRPDVPVLTHVHELGFAFRLTSALAPSQLLSRTRQFIACSDAVRKNLISEQGVAPDRVETVYESIPVEQVRTSRTRRQVLEEMRVPDSAKIVMGGGAHSWRKGSDLFVQLARAVCQQRSDVYFAWIGGLVHEVMQLERDVHLAGLAEKVRLTGVVSKPADYFAAADVFALTSREDPYPLVCLEAAALQKPIVCFAGGGGMPEFVEDDCGFVVPYLDVMAMAHRVVSLLDSSECRLRMGAAAREKVTRRHDIGMTAPRIMDIIERTIVGA